VPDAYHRKPDVIVSMSGETWAMLYLSQTTPEDLIESGNLKVIGDSSEAARLINLFDRYSPQKALVIPTTAVDHIL
jgi:alkyl sulfatase BDS1-like metallo-beta-lactamase superfamily hydrolase